jgi:hypothetical protein
VFSLSSPSHGNFSLTTILSSTTTDLAITITNVYAPFDHSHAKFRCGDDGSPPHRVGALARVQ